MESLKRSIKYQFSESKKFILTFWIIIILVDIFFIILNYLGPLSFSIGFSLGTRNGVTAISIVGSNLMAILISFLVYNFVSNYESFPLSLSLSMSRKDYFISFLVENIVIAFVFATIQGVLLKIDPYIVKLLGRVPLYDFFYFNTKTDSLILIILNLFLIFLEFICFWNLIASINYKIGYKMWLIFAGVKIISSMFYINLIYECVKFIGTIYNEKIIIIEILAVIVLYILNYFIVMSTDVKRGKQI